VDGGFFYPMAEELSRLGMGLGVELFFVESLLYVERVEKVEKVEVLGAFFYTNLHFLVEVGR